MSATFAGSGVGLSLGALYLAAGMAGHAVEHARGRGMADAAQAAYSDAARATPAPILAPNAGVAEIAARAPSRRVDLECLTEAVYYEARGESPRGQAAVAQVVMNRVRHPAFPKSVCAVVFQGAGRNGCQFSFACDGSMKQRREVAAWSRARSVAARALAGVAVADIGSATHFHTTAVAPAWGPQMLRVATVGVHVFYRFAPYRLRAPVQADSDHAVLISAPAPHAPEIRIQPALVERPAEEGPAPAIAAPPIPERVPEAPAEAAALTTPKAHTAS